MEDLLLIFQPLQKLSETFKGLLVEVQRMASASSQVENAISQVADGAKEQLSATQEISQQMQENSDISNNVNEKARNTSDMAREAAKISDHGKLESVEMMRVVEKIENNSEEIGKISDLIDEIAQQTNMLSLNASIEAARAGEQGRGFSVVATEVGKLAERSGSSVKDISELTKSHYPIGAGVGSLFVFKGKYKAVLINYPSKNEIKDIL